MTMDDQIDGSEGPLTSRATLTSLIRSISKDRPPEDLNIDQPSSNQNPLTSEPHLKEIFLTLHVLFPNELLPALDLLDRGLVTRMALLHPALTAKSPEDPITTARGLATGSSDIYHVRSARPQPSNSRYQSYDVSTPTYEVRLKAWSCSCPAFAFAAFPSTTAAADTEEVALTGAYEGSTFNFGGLSKGSDYPVCKHLLACVLAFYGGAGFANNVEHKTVGVEEMAGWGAGWGD